MGRRESSASAEPIWRFMSHVTPEPNTGCWLWTGTTNNVGYGQFSHGERALRRQVLAHRWLWEYICGPIPRGLEVDHRCRLRVCVNPDHLDLVTHRENVCRGYAARRAARAKNGGLNGASNGTPPGMILWPPTQPR